MLLASEVRWRVLPCCASLCFPFVKVLMACWVIGWEREGWPSILHPTCCATMPIHSHHHHLPAFTITLLTTPGNPSHAGAGNGFEFDKVGRVEG